MTMTISASDPHPRRRVHVAGTEMSYVETGQGKPIVFLHGNPTWSYLWRNVIPHVSDLGRCLAPDLVGMGQSGPSPTGSYRFGDHAACLDAWFDTLGLSSDVVLVVHDWGSALGLHRASRYPQQVSGIAYMEAIVQPRYWADFPNGRDRAFRALRSPDGERMIFEDNFFIETILPKSIMRRLSDDELAMYRKPFVTRAARKPTLEWPRELPIEGEPADVVEIVERYGAWLAQSPVPKLFINADPGALIAGRARECCRAWPNQREVTVKGIHFVQEDSPNDIGAALRTFIKELRGGRHSKADRTNKR
jgi:haloalkane dehalogenase